MLYLFLTSFIRLHTNTMSTTTAGDDLSYLLASSSSSTFFSDSSSSSSLTSQSTTTTTTSNNLPSHLSHPSLGDFSARVNSDDFTVEIFSAPKPFIDEDAINNKRAIRSWLALSPRPSVTLLGYETGYDEVAEEFGLNIERRVDKNFLGVPLFNSMFARANASRATVSVIINGDILLFDDFMATVRRVASTFEHFLIVSARYDIDKLPDIPRASGDEGVEGVRGGEREGGGGGGTGESYNDIVRNHVWETGTLHTYGGMDVWAWNTNGPRLFDPVMPHFVFGRGKYDNWLTHETISAGRRQVIDVSEVCLTVHVKHDYRFVVDDAATANASAVSAYWSKGKTSKFELFINIYLSLHAGGSYVNQKGSVLFAPWKLSRCIQGDGMCLQKRARPGVCNCEFSPFMKATQTDPEVRPGSNIIRCGSVSSEKKDSFIIPVRPPTRHLSVTYEYDTDDRLVRRPAKGGDEDNNVLTPLPFGLPLTLSGLLERVPINNTVLLTALNYGYRGFLMNWACNMRQLAVSNFIVAALDEELYRFAFTRGLPVYYENTIFASAGGGEGGNGEMNQSILAHATYGTDAFKLLTKMKSRVVVRLLRRGVNVLWTDCDIIYFRNPLSDLWAYNVDLAIQSNAPDDEPLNARRRLNSGLYLARSSKHMIAAFDAVIRFATRSRMSEQPCFYDVMCGKQGETAVGDDGCVYNDSVTIRLLDRNKYPNGITAGIWNTTDGHITKQWPHLFVLHNNWVVGKEKKPRFERHGFTFFDDRSETCTYSLDVQAETTPQGAKGDNEEATVGGRSGQGGGGGGVAEKEETGGVWWWPWWSGRESN